MRALVSALSLALLVGACAEPGGVATTAKVVGTPPVPVRTAAYDGAQAIGLEALPERLAGADVVILGEVHDNAEHHRVQAALVRALSPKGLAAEMIPRASEEGIAAFLAEGGSYDAIGPAIGWERLGWPDWDLYRPVFEAAEGAVITGGALPRKMIRDAIGADAEAVAAASSDAALVRALGFALSPADQKAAEAEMIAAHCNMLPASAAPGMVEAQRLRDASFAAAVMRAYEAAGGPVVLLTGSGHARTDRGVPAYLAVLAPDLKVVSVGQVEAEGADAAAAERGEDFDFVVAAAPQERPDPCAAFQ